jgi:hypothetical protein
MDQLSGVWVEEEISEFCYNIASFSSDKNLVLILKHSKATTKRPNLA